MSLAVASRFAKFCAGVVFWAVPAALHPQQLPDGNAVTAAASAAALPDAPAPRLEAGMPPDGAAQSQGTQTAPAGATPASPSSQDGSTSQSGSASQTGSSSQAAPAETEAQKSQRELADEQLKQQEKQRVMGVMATFNTTRDPDAVPLSSSQKFKLFFKSATDPWPFLLAGVVGAIDQASDSPPEWRQGWGPYAQRFGASYSDYFIGNFFGNAVLPSLLHEDPRYFQKGKGKVITRILWAAGSSFWCKRDNGGWGPNWGNVGGNFIGTAIARVYYPASERNVHDTLMDGLTVTIEGMPGAELIEFWPDMVRHYRRKQAEKLAKEEAAKDSASSQDNDGKPHQQ